VYLQVQAVVIERFQYSSIIKRRFSSQGMFHWNRLERDRGLPKGVTSSVGPGLLL